MKKSVFYILIALLFFLNCKKKIVIFPIPATFSVLVELTIDPATQTFQEVRFLTGQEMLNTLLDALEGESLEAIKDGAVEGMSFTLTEADLTHAVMNGVVLIEYQGGADTLFVLPDNLIIGEALNIEEIIEMTEAGTAILQNALNNVLNRNLQDSVTFYANGNVFQPVSRIVIRIDLGISVNFEQEIEIFDPF